VNEPSVAAASPTLEAALNGLAEALFDKRTVHLDDSTTATDQQQLDADDDDLLLDENTDLALSSSSLALILPLVGAVLEDAPSPAAAQVALRLVAAHAGGAQLEDDVSVHTFVRQLYCVLLVVPVVIVLLLDSMYDSSRSLHWRTCGVALDCVRLMLHDRCYPD
jgi:hypothetical protein